jgi:sugar lactone lactonase YvrE
VESENANATALSTESEVVRKSALLKLTTEAPTDGSQGYTIDKSTLLIVDSLGNEVFKKDLTGNEYEWEATDATGARVPEGVYYAMCRFTTTGGANSITSPMRLVVVRAAK